MSNEIFELWLNDQYKYKLMVVVLMIALIYYQFYYNHDVQTYKSDWSFAKCYGRNETLWHTNVSNESVIDTSFINQSEYIKVLP